MPSQSKKQHNFMEMIAHDPKKAKQLKVPSSVGKDFVAADKGKKFKSGGDVKKLKSIFKGKDSQSEELKEAKAIKSGKITPAQYAKGEKMEKAEKSEPKKFANGGRVTPETYNVKKHKTDEYPQFKCGGTVKKADGGNLALFGSRKVSEGQGMRPPGSDEVGSAHKAMVNKINTPTDPATKETTPNVKTAQTPPPKGTKVPTATSTPPKATANPSSAPRAIPKATSKPRPSQETSASRASRMKAYENWTRETRDPQAKSYLETGMKKGGKTKHFQVGGIAPAQQPVVAPAAVPVQRPVVAPQAVPVQPRVMKKGGSVTRADGCVTKGHTRGRFC